jgi:hypothetical protein
MPQQRRPAIPARAIAACRDIVAVAGRERDRDQRFKAQRRGEGCEGALDVAKAWLGKVDQVDLVDRQHDVADAQQRHDGGVAARLLHEPLACIDQQDGELGVRGARHHVARVLPVARRVGDDEGPPRGREETVGDVDGDALLALGIEPVEQQGIVDPVAGGAEAPRILPQRLRLVVEQPGRIGDQPTDESRLAVVDRAAGEKAQRAATRHDGQRYFPAGVQK